MAKSLTTVSLAEIRRRAVEAQGYAQRGRNGTAAEVLATIRRLACVQLDSISTVERSHRIALGARVGDYPEAAVSKLMRTGRIFEYWAHEACLVPIEDFRMHRWRMARLAESHPWRGNVFEREPELTERVLREVAERGPLGSRHFDGSGDGGMWNWKPAKVVLEALHSAGRLVIAGRENFQRLYDLPERLVPHELLDGEPEGPLPAAVLLSPFDNLLWDRTYLERVFGFRHVIEVYKREHERVYGYYVLPLLRRDRIVGRADLKHDRSDGVLRVRAFHPEPGVRGSLDDTLDAALQRLARVLGAERVARS